MKVKLSLLMLAISLFAIPLCAMDNELDPMDITPDAKIVLAELVEKNDLYNIEQLLYAGLSPNLCITDTNAANIPILYKAAAEGNINLMKLLLKYKANPNQIFKLHGETPLHGALRYCPNQEKIELLVKNGADLTVKNNNLNTPLHIASSFQYPFVLPLLINEDAINCKNIYGLSPLIEALKSLCTGNIRYLLTNDIAIPHLYYGKDNQIHILVLIKKLHDSDNSVLYRRQYRKIAQAIILLEGMYTARACISKKGIGSNLPADLNKKIGRYLAYEKLTH